MGLMQQFRPHPPRPIGAPPELYVLKPKTPEQVEREARWPGDGPVPSEDAARVIYIVYQLSQAGQRQAFLTTTKDMELRHRDRSIDRMQIRPMNYWEDGFADALELAWFCPDGAAYCLVGGRETFEFSPDRGPHHSWKLSNGSVLGLWYVHTYTGCGGPWYSTRQRETTGVRVDAAGLSAEDLLEVEQIRLHDIRQSKKKAEVEMAALNGDK